ncbi:CRISPR-associated endonuclease Cas1 [Pokkaliibacter sp. MBI-7]|uniref:CRISPR-associated endonuclease Cas1 n=1 Tax=Pokkaliibacter sp. MBI-7 TaxID=3040600 RepID=UPI00244CAF8E|nr:CRISPR-associated endonuclease Cas1 [Pokkaliibacter sp. MBI-7]MDH2431446.1 CRISPR-associated endonuclease Cas1 [Pokkaliibacter sp. MBI-7]
MSNLPFSGLDTLSVLFPLRSVQVSLQLTSAIETGYFHHVMLHGWLRNLAGSPEHFSDGLTLTAPETGRTHYAAGDTYRFTLTATAAAEPLLALLLKRLRLLPASASHISAAHILHDNLRCLSLTDSVSGEPVRQLSDLHPIGLTELEALADQASQLQHCELRFISPVRLKQVEVTRQRKGKARYCRDAPHFDWSLFSQRLADAFINQLHCQTGVRYSRPSMGEAHVQAAVAFWVEHRYSREDKDLGGALTMLQLSALHTLPRWAWAMLILGQYLGIGQSRGFGLGQYRLLPELTLMKSAQPTVRLIDLCLRPDNLQQTVNDSQQQGKVPEAIALPPLLDELNHRAALLQSGNYQVPAMQQSLTTLPSGRALLQSIPPWQERLLQRAVVRFLTATMEKLWMQQSYGFRPGYTREQAKEQINILIEQGYQWVLECDVAHFYDSVDWRNLERRLSLLLNDPLADLIMAWVKAAVLDSDGEPLWRQQGLPLGAVISQLLVNILLDDFDADMLANDYCLVRYGDDFVLLFTQREHAEQALPRVIRSLQEHGFALADSQTRITPVSHGFHYLGFYFIDGYALDLTHTDDHPDLPLVDAPLETTDYTEDSTVSPTGLTALSEKAAEQPQDESSLSVGERQQLGTFLVVAGDVAILNCENRRLLVTQNDQEYAYSWHGLAAILLVGPHQITTPALRQAMYHDVPIHFADGFGHYQGVCSQGEPGAGGSTWLLQLHHSRRHEQTLAIARTLIAARLKGQYGLIYRRARDWHGLTRLDSLKRDMENATDLAQLRGYEGEAARILWQFFREQLAEEWHFNGRQRRPPPDPVNAMLSLGYTHLYHLTDSLIRTVGLYPWAGYYHQGRGKHCALASDMMEPFRILVERAVLALINRREVLPSDFSLTPQGCFISHDGRKRLLTLLLAQLTRPAGAEGLRPLDALSQQIQSLLRHCRTGSDFIAWSPGH